MRIKNFTAEPEVMSRQGADTFFVGIGDGPMWAGTRWLTKDEARQLRNELSQFLGEQDGVNGMALVAWTALNNENKKLRQQVAWLEKDNADLREENVDCAKANHALNVESVSLNHFAAMRQRCDALVAENARLGVAIMNARAALAPEEA